MKLECHLAETPIVNKAIHLLTRTVRERTGQVLPRGPRGTIILELEPGIGPEGFRIEGPPYAIRIAGNDERGLLYGVGKLLRDARWGQGTFQPGQWRGTSVPGKPIRAMYFATHYHNFYHDAPVAQVVRYIEELALWGCNTLVVWFDMHHYRGMGDPAAQAMVKRLRTFLATANAVGMSGGLTLIANEGFDNSPPRLRADGMGGKNGYFLHPRAFYFRELCPSTPGGLKEILRERRAMLEAFADLNIKYLWSWPYDQGGCTCRACAPWGVNGFLRSSQALANLTRQYWPQAKMVLSTWYFDHFIKGEWEGLSKAFAKGAPEWVDYLLADDFHGFPEYPRRNGAPGKLPMVGFPEISMDRNFPWGSFGANPRPFHYQEYWQTTRELLAGTFPYSEGIYEDINKVLLLQLEWWPERSTADILREYAAYEFETQDAAAVVTACQLMEAGLNHALAQPKDPWKWLEGHLQSGKKGLPTEPLYQASWLYAPRRYLELLQAAEETMPVRARGAWRWRILLLHALLDVEIYEHGGRATATTEKICRELHAIYHSPQADGPLLLVSFELLQKMKKRYARKSLHPAKGG